MYPICFSDISIYASTDNVNKDCITSSSLVYLRKDLVI